MAFCALNPCPVGILRFLCWQSREELQNLNYDFHKCCPFPYEEEEILEPNDLIASYQAERKELESALDDIMSNVTCALNHKPYTTIHFANKKSISSRLALLQQELPEKLYKSILQQAIQGKLTERDLADEPASELLLRIRTMRKELQKQKIAKKTQATETIDDKDTTFELPENWVWAKLGWICQKVGAGSTPKGGAAVYVNQGVKFLREQNIHDDGLHLDGVVYIDERTNAQMSGSIVQAQDILMNITGGSIGRNALVPDNFDEANINQHVLIIRLVDKALRQYLHLCLSAPFVLNQMFSRQIGDKPGLSATKVENFIIPLPPIAEQMRIVDRVNELFAVCDELK